MEEMSEKISEAIEHDFLNMIDKYALSISAHDVVFEIARLVTLLSLKTASNQIQGIQCILNAMDDAINHLETPEDA